jgi:hypothetical protein
MPSRAQIVVMNPPYVRQELIPQRKKEYYTDKFGLDRKSDIYAYFFVRAINLLSGDGALYVVKAATRRTGIGRRVFNHLLRDSRATYLLANGMKEAQVKALFGWTPESTMLSRYSHLTSKDAKSGLLQTLGLEPEKVAFEQLFFDEDRLPPAKPATSSTQNIPPEVLAIVIALVKSGVVKVQEGKFTLTLENPEIRMSSS